MICPYAQYTNDMCKHISYTLGHTGYYCEERKCKLTSKEVLDLSCEKKPPQHEILETNGGNK